MRKMKKPAAFILAALMALSLGTTVFAQESVTDPSIPDSSEESHVTKPSNPDSSIYPYVTGATDKDGNTVNVTVNDASQEVKDILNDEQKVKDIFNEAGFVVGDDTKFVVIGQYDLTVESMPEGGIDLNYYGAVYDKDIKPGDTLYVMHQKHDGTWEVFNYVVDEHGVVKLHFDSLSPVAFVKVLSDGRVVVLDQKKNVVAEVKDDKAVQATVKTSPKTGE